MPIVDSCFDVVDPRRDVPGFQSVCLAAITFCSYCTSCCVILVPMSAGKLGFSETFRPFCCIQCLDFSSLQIVDFELDLTVRDPVYVYTVHCIQHQNMLQLVAYA